MDYTVKESKKEMQERMAKKVKKEMMDLIHSDMCNDEDVRWAARIQVPFTLQKHMVDEWSLLTKGGDAKKLLSLPRPYSAKKVLRDFVMAKTASNKVPDKDQVGGNAAELKAYHDVCVGLLSYFNKSLPSLLLYRQERKQYTAVKEKLLEEGNDVQLFDVYGAEHVLRFFARLPKLLSNVVMPDTEINLILSTLSDLLKFMQKHANKYLDLKDYMPANEDFCVSVAASGEIASP